VPVCENLAVGNWWQILLGSVGAVLTAFIAGAYSARNARKTPYEVLQALSTLMDNSTHFDETDRNTLKEAVQREVHRISQLNSARQQGFWAYQRERVRIALQLDSRRRVSQRSLALPVLLLVAGCTIMLTDLGQLWASIIARFSAGEFSELPAYGPIILATFFAGLVVMVWSAARIALPTIRWLVTYVHVLPSYLLLTAIAVMVCALLAGNVESPIALFGGLVTIPVLVGLLMYAARWIEPRILLRFRSHEFARRRLRAQLRRRRIRASTVSAASTLTALALIVLTIGLSIPPLLRTEPQSGRYAYQEWGGYAALWQDQKLSVSTADWTTAPATLVYAVWLDDSATKKSFYDEVRAMTTAEKVIVGGHGPIRIQYAEVHITQPAIGFMICHRPDSYDNCSPWVRL
jgi:hypothetical protein